MPEAVPTATRPYVHSGFLMRHVVDPITIALGGPTLVIRGRRSGRQIQALVPPFELDGARYLVPGGGETQWVRDLRAAGEGELRPARRGEPFRAVELLGAERDRAVVAYRERLGRRAAQIFKALPDPAEHPALRIDQATSDR